MREMNDKGVQNLIEGIVRQAADDYRNARRGELRSRDQGHYIPSALKRECERFFRSSWFEMLTGLDGEAILEKLEAER